MTIFPVDIHARTARTHEVIGFDGLHHWQPHCPSFPADVDNLILSEHQESKQGFARV